MWFINWVIISGKNSFSLSSEDLSGKDSLILVAELKGNVEEYDVGEQVMRSLGDYFRKSETSDNSILGLFFR